MRKKVVIIILTVALFFGMTILGVFTTFRVDSVTLETSKISEPAEAESQELLKRLESVYVKENIFTAKQSDADEVMSEFPYFRITSFKRAYPNRIVITVSEGEEVYALENSEEEGKYYILNGEGTVLGEREDPNNRLGGSRNVILRNFTCAGEKGGKLNGDVAIVPTLEICMSISERLNGIRGNLESVEVLARTSPVDGIVLLFKMQEGVEIYFYTAENNMLEKTVIALDAYFALSEFEKMSGCIMVYDNIDGMPTTAYRPEGGLPA